MLVWINHEVGGQWLIRTINMCACYIYSYLNNVAMQLTADKSALLSVIFQNNSQVYTCTPLHTLSITFIL